MAGPIIVNRVCWFLLLGILVVASGEEVRGQKQPPRDRDPRQEHRNSIGRYQLVAHSGQLILLDTATGRCWNRTARGEWRYEGNPTRGLDRPESERKPDAIVLDEDEEIKLLIHQREVREIPGSRGTLRIHLSDITEGQAVLTVSSPHRDKFLERDSVSQGGEMTFTAGRRRFTIQIVELRNLLTGDDFARLLITPAGRDDDDESDTDDATTKTDSPQSDSDADPKQ